jgi:hypothetical protein
MENQCVNSVVSGVGRAIPLLLSIKPSIDAVEEVTVLLCAPVAFQIVIGFPVSNLTPCGFRAGAASTRNRRAEESSATQRRSQLRRP